MSSVVNLDVLRQYFGDRLQENVSLSRYTAARIGGMADVMVTVNSSYDLADAITFLWKGYIPFMILGSGSNVLVSDAGVRQVVVLNHAKRVRFYADSESPSVWVESGANLGNLARRAAAHGYSGLEWAAGIPGTVGGAVYGNAGAHGGDLSGNLLVANILQLYQVVGEDERKIAHEDWPPQRFEYAYRCSAIKRHPGRVVVLSAELKLSMSTPEQVKSKMDEFRAMRQASQPSGASLGSIFKNPPGDYAGRLIEAAGLKGTSVGKVEISTNHANFFISHESAKARDYAELIKLAQREVMNQFGVRLDLEIELVGDWMI